MKYKISGINCIGCANSIENILKKDKNISHVSVDSGSGSLFITYENSPYTIEKLEEILKPTGQGIRLEREGTAHENKPIFNSEIIWAIARILFSGILLAFAAIFPLDETLKLIVFAVAYLIVAYDILWQAIKNIFAHKDILDEHALMSVATIGAFVINQRFEAVLVALLYQVGEIMQDVAVNKSRNSIMNAIDLRPNKANLFNDGITKVVAPSELKIGDTILIRVGEVVPVDGVILTGEGLVDASSLTGEPLPIPLKISDSVRSGEILKTGSLTVKVTHLFQDSTMSKILDLVTNNGERKAKAEKFITKFAKVYTPIVFALATILAVIPPLFFRQSWDEYIYRALIFLVISCPCAIIISVPLAYFAGLGLASRNGIIIKGANFLDRLCDVESLMFDKTGTITKGTFVVEKVKPTDMDVAEFERIIVSLESLSAHPIAKAVLSSFSDVVPDTKAVGNFNEILGMGISATFEGHRMILGNETLLVMNNVYFIPAIDVGNIIHLAIDGVYKGFIVLNDEVKKNSRNLITELRNRGVSTVMLTGDHQSNAEYVAFQLNVDQTFYELMPEDKLSYLEMEMAKRKGAVAFVGDGVNDAPSIIRSDVGIAMGGIGSDVAVENSDIVIMNDDPMKVVDAIDIAKKVRKLALSNIIIALLVKILVLALAAIGIEQMWMAVLADVGLSIALILNSLTLLRRHFN